MDVFSFGGGVQSTAALVLAARGELAVDAFLFANVGDDSESPDTLRYVREVAVPFAKAHGVALHELRRLKRDGTPETIYERLTAVRPRVNIPMRLPSGAPAKRQCTSEFKIDVVNRWLREHGATRKRPATVMLGISTDEELRAARGVGGGPLYVRRRYPFLEAGARKSRQDCVNVVRSAGLPVPPKSACWFCPWHSVAAWRELRDKNEGLFWKAACIEENINADHDRRGLPAMWLTRALKPLAFAVEGEQPSLFEETCESGYCMV